VLEGLRERGGAKAVGINLWCVGGDWVSRLGGYKVESKGIILFWGQGIQYVLRRRSTMYA
jgi:hypothetical protein